MIKLTEEREKELEALCRQFRIDIISILHELQTGHAGGSLSECEILVTLYMECANISIKSSTDFLIIFSYLRKCWKGLLYQTFPAFCVSEDTPHIMAFRSLIWHWKVVKP